MLPETELFRAVIFRAVCDSLGFTNEPKRSRRHVEAVREAREWFYDAGSDFIMICDLADFNSDIVRQGTVDLIEARQSGDHSKIPTYWRDAFRRNRMPSMNAYADLIDEQLNIR